MYSLYHSTMTRSCSRLVLAAVIQVIFGKIPRELADYGIYHPYQQMIPRDCWHPPPEIDLYKCCPIPNLYSNEVFDSCGIEKPPEEGSNVPAGPKKVPCQDGICLMTKTNLLMANGSVDYEKLRTYIDQWAAENPDFTEAILKAKPSCAKPKGEDLTQLTKMCDPDLVFVCLQAQILWNCKLKEEFVECQLLKNHMDECRPYYMKPEGFDEKFANRHKDRK